MDEMKGNFLNCARSPLGDGSLLARLKYIWRRLLRRTLRRSKLCGAKSEVCLVLFSFERRALSIELIGNKNKIAITDKAHSSQLMAHSCSFAQVSDTTGDDQRTKAGSKNIQINKTTLKRERLKVLPLGRI